MQNLALTIYQLLGMAFKLRSGEGVDFDSVYFCRPSKDESSLVEVIFSAGQGELAEYALDVLNSLQGVTVEGFETQERNRILVSLN